MSNNRCHVLLLGSSIPESAYARVVSILGGFDLQADPSGVRSEGSWSGEKRGSSYQYLRLEVASLTLFLNEDACRKALRIASNDLNVDILFFVGHQEEASPRLFAFDMDSTLIAAEGIDELAKLGGVTDHVRSITKSAMEGRIDFQESFRLRAALLRGISAKEARDLCYSLPLAEGVEHLMLTLRAMGHKTAILSGGFDFLAEHLRQRLRMDHAIGNRLEESHGKLTGNVLGEIVDAAHKEKKLRAIADENSIPLHHTVAVGDGANDIPMLQAAGVGIAFHAKPLVREHALYSIDRVGLHGLLYLPGMQSVSSLMPA